MCGVGFSGRLLALSDSTRMADLWKRIIALRDPQLTANFQNFCGIRSLQHSEQNGKCVSTNNGHSPNSNGFCKSEECCENHESHSANGDAHPLKNGSLPYQNGCATVSDSHLKNRHAQKNGFVHNGVSNGDVSHLQNGTSSPNGASCKCRHGASKPNGFIHAPKDSSTESTKSTAPTPTFKVDNKLLYYIFSFGASLGNEIFYIVYFSFGLWCCDSFVFRKVSIVWCVIMYIGQAAKDLICWPRPRSPPAIRLEERYELEYGMPSTHAMVGVVIPFMAVYYSYADYQVSMIDQLINVFTH